MSLYLAEHCPFSHRIQIVLAEKGVSTDDTYFKNPHTEKKILELNPYGTTPILIGKDVILYEPDIIFEYLEERFPHPPLLSVFPIDRSAMRLIIKNIDQHWMPHLIGAYESNQKKSYAHKVELVKIILSTIPNFNQFKYFTSNEYSIADCAFYTLLSRLPELNITLPPRALCINKYYERICQREAIQTVLELRHEAKNTPSPAFVSNPKLTKNLHLKSAQVKPSTPKEH